MRVLLRVLHLDMGAFDASSPTLSQPPMMVVTPERPFRSEIVRVRKQHDTAAYVAAVQGK